MSVWTSVDYGRGPLVERFGDGVGYRFWDVFEGEGPVADADEIICEEGDLDGAVFGGDGDATVGGGDVAHAARMLPCGGPLRAVVCRDSAEGVPQR